MRVEAEMHEKKKPSNAERHAPGPRADSRRTPNPLLNETAAVSDAAPIADPRPGCLAVASIIADSYDDGVE